MFKHFKSCCPIIKSIANLKIVRTFKTDSQKHQQQFETVFSFPSVKYVALINRLKVYQMIGTSLSVPSCGVMELYNIFPSNTFFIALYIGLTGTTVLSLATLPFRNIIGHLYISQDNKHIKISSLDFWGRRKDRIVPTEDWIPILDLPSRTTDALYLSPQLADGTKYKLPVRFGKIYNAQKMGQVLE